MEEETLEELQLQEECFSRTKRKANFLITTNKQVTVSKEYSSDQRANSRLCRFLKKCSSDQRAYPRFGRFSGLDLLFVPRFGKFEFSRFEKLEKSGSQKVSGNCSHTFSLVFATKTPIFFNLFVYLIFHAGLLPLLDTVLITN